MFNVESPQSHRANIEVKVRAKELRRVLKSRSRLSLRLFLAFSSPSLDLHSLLKLEDWPLEVSFPFLTLNSNQVLDFEDIQSLLTVFLALDA